MPDAAASDEVVAGAREELARAGRLEPREGFPRMEIEVLGESEVSEGVQARARAPVARATGVGLVARAWVMLDPASSRQEDTGDLRAEEVIAVDVAGGVRDPKAAVFHAADARRAAAQRLGRKLARKLMGMPAASEEEEDDR